jgi:hypothetical protein
LFDELSKPGNDYEPWTREELKKLAGLNLIRVMKAVEKVRDEMEIMESNEKHIPYKDLVENNVTAVCRSDLEFYNKTK